MDLNLDGTSRTDILLEIGYEYNRFPYAADIRKINSLVSREDDNLLSVYIPYHSKRSEIHGHPLFAYFPFSFWAALENNSRFVVSEFYDR